LGRRALIVALSLVLSTVSLASVKHKSGRVYVAAGNGQITLPAPDAVRLQGDSLQFAAGDWGECLTSCLR
jgi:hypothetical protein